MNSTGIKRLLRSIPREAHMERAVLRETHISWVILCGEFAYKIKKPVNFGFLDFSSLELRRHFCEEELRLNRRFSPELYLAVVPITQDEQGPMIDGIGPTIDYAVKMRRFNEEQLLDGIAAREGLDNTLLRALAGELARLHENLTSCHPDPDGSEPGTPAALHKAIEQNFQQIRNYAVPAKQLRQLQGIRQWTQRRYDELLPKMVQRVVDGRVIDGHGDAHLGNIALVDGTVRLFDCIEFNASFRIMDSISEIAFLTMDMDARGYHESSHRLLTDYLEYSGDYAGLTLLKLYVCYFSMVRAKVSLLREPIEGTAITTTEGYREFLRYLELARSCTIPGRIFLAITHGVSGSGKSTIAGALVESSGAVRIRSDVERKRLAGMAPEQRSKPRQRTSLYSTDMTRKTFSRLEELATMAIEAGFPVIIDATFLHRNVRATFHQLARKLSVPFAIVDCMAEPDQLRARLIKRERHDKDASEADVAVMEKQLGTVQALTPEEQPYRLAVDSAEDATTLWHRFQAQIAEPSSATA
jgi:aminoglycoside phosphotransferase family enzyme/predicted kinase